jgi:hypothetical protein
MRLTTSSDGSKFKWWLVGTIRYLWCVVVPFESFQYPVCSTIIASRWYGLSILLMSRLSGCAANIFPFLHFSLALRLAGCNSLGFRDRFCPEGTVETVCLVHSMVWLHE